MKKLIVLFLAVCACLYLSAQVRITLKKTFVESIKNKVTVSAESFEVYFSGNKAHSAAEDGDLHFSGYDKKIGMPIVAEIMNAKEVPDAIAFAKDHQGEGKPDTKVKVSGVWRLWCEHPNEFDVFKQGPLTVPIVNTNPAHIFEIHPVTKIGNIELAQTLHEIDGYTKIKDAEKAFSKYNNLPCRIKSTATTITIVTNQIGYNYVDFWIKLIDKHPLTVSDGKFAFCAVYGSDFTEPTDEDDDEDINADLLIAHKMRMVFPKGSEAFDKIGNMQVGKYLHVVGIPRINLALISWRVSHAATNPELLSWNLPIEMIVVGIID